MRTFQKNSRDHVKGTCSTLAVVIPAYQPASSLLSLVRGLASLHYRRIIVINDGSDEKKAPLFAQLSDLPEVTVLEHPKNLGKGAALKTGFTHILAHYPEVLGVITVDADGQHLLEDIENISGYFLNHPTRLILGVRKFDDHVPWRSRFGNNLTRYLFRRRFGLDITDTQTGLRGIPIHLLSLFLSVPQTRYEFEMACLMRAIHHGCQIMQVPIRTVYLDQNAMSHFRPIIDSIRVYLVFLRLSVFKSGAE